jgi:hypothetical protein
MTPAQLPLPLFFCTACGVQDTPRLQRGSGPHTAKAVCAHCGTFLRWVPKRLLQQSSHRGIRMSGGVNRTILVGSIGRYGVEMRYAPNGSSIATFTLVCTEVWNDGSSHDLYVPCEIVGKRAEAASELEAGTPILFEGRLAKRKKGEQWELLVSGWDCSPIQLPAPTGS